MSKEESVNSLPNASTAGAETEFAFQSSEQKKSPQLGHRGLTIMLSLMCLIPVVTIAALWGYLPKVYEGKLEATVLSRDLPNQEFYSVDYYKRPVYTKGVLIIRNNSDQDWTHLNIQVNGNYQIYDVEPILAHGEKQYDLNRFLNRTGARFSLQYNELNRIRIYARRPTKDRATFYQDFPTHYPISSNYWPSIILLGVFVILVVISVVLFAKINSANKAANKAAMNA